MSVSATEGSQSPDASAKTSRFFLHEPIRTSTCSLPDSETGLRFITSIGEFSGVVTQPTRHVVTVSTGRLSVNFRSCRFDGEGLQLVVDFVPM
jgi:hypothetical protein